MNERAPVFIKVDEYKTILELMDAIKKRLDQAKTLLARATELKQQEDAQIENWTRDLEDVEERLAAMDKTLMEPQV